MNQGSGLLTPVRLWRERLSARLVTAVLAMSVFCAVLLTANDFRASARMLDAQIESIGRTLANTIAFTCGDAIATADTSALESYAKYLLTQPEVIIAFVRIERADGRVLNMETSPAPEQIAASDTRAFRTPVILRPENIVLGHCTIWLEVAPWQAELWERTVSALLQNLVAFALIATVLTLLLRSWLGRPLSQLDAAAQRIATGDLEAAVPPSGVGELRRFTRTLDTMRESLRASHASLAAQNEQLREVDRLKNEFIANTSHEIRTPLSSILGSVELLDDASPEDQAQLLDALRRNGNHLLFLINQILDFSKLQADSLCIELQDVAVRPLLEDVIACIRPQARDKGLDLQLHCSADAPERIHSDPLRLRQILMNLLGNAIKFTSHGHVQLLARRIQSTAGTQVELTVEDTGPGISEQARQRLFVPFAQGDSSLARRFGGTGLGLAISRQLARTLGGDLTLASEVGVGTKVAVTLPAALSAPVGAPSPAAPTTAPAAMPGPGPIGGRVLLVDDAADNRRLLSTMLRKAGVDVTTAEDGERGCQRVAEADAGGRPFDLVLMDIQMPVLDGHAAARRLRQQGCRIPLVALTAHATEQDREACMAAGFDEYATKPISRAQLGELVARYVAAARS